MTKPFLFMAGEYNVTMPVVFETDDWQHTMTASRVIYDHDVKILKREKFKENLKGIVYYARMDNYKLECRNLFAIIASMVPCWPNPVTLRKMSSRHQTMLDCIIEGLTTDQVYVKTIQSPNPIRSLVYRYLDCKEPLVLKYGQLHQGNNKIKFDSGVDLVRYLNIRDVYESSDYSEDDKETQLYQEYTVEPFYEGLSTRVLFIGDRAFGVQYKNDESWIKNGPGGEYDDWIIPKNVLEHALKVKESFELDVAGIDYVVEPDGSFHFLEVNQYPGLNVNEESVKVAREFLRIKMKDIREKAG